MLVAGHDQSGHLCRAKTYSIISKSFTWPGISGDIQSYVQGFKTCQFNSKATPAKAPLKITETFAIPFERIALDIVGPFPKSRRNNYRYILTAICVSSHYSWAIPLRSITAEDVVSGVISIFKDCQFPQEILTDRVTQFMSYVNKQFCSIFNIKHLRTTAYRPQSNGILERFHATLVSIIVFALRNMPHRDHGYTPFELVYGRRTPHVVRYMYEFWKEDRMDGVDVCTYMAELEQKLDVLRTDMQAKLREAKTKQRMKEDDKILRTFSVDDKVLFRTPGLSGKLESSWDGPFVITKCIGDLNYVIKKVKDGRQHKRVVHINHLKPFSEEFLIVNMVVVTSDEGEEMESKCTLSHPVLSEEQKCELDGVLSKFSSILFSETPGNTHLATFGIDTTSDVPINLPPYKIPLGLEAQFKQELKSLLDQNIIEKSTAKWAFPMIPVHKKDGGLRLVVDYRRLNAITVFITLLHAYH